MTPDPELMEALLRRILPRSPWYVQHVDDNPPSLGGEAISRVRGNGCVAIVTGRRIEITEDEYELVMSLIGPGEGA